MPFCNVFGIRVAATTPEAAVNTVCRYLPKWRGRYVTFVNVHAVCTAQDKASYLRAQQGAVLSLPDGFPVALYAKRNGYPKAQRIAGPDFMEAVFKKSAGGKYRHYFYGSSEKVLHALQEHLEREYPGIVIAGTYAPPRLKSFSKERMERDIERINETAPDFVWIGLGAPKQEYWMQEAAGRVNGLMLGVGAGFDFHAGTVKRAPEWMQRIGMEWVFRMLQEPGRLIPRYSKTNIRFLKMWIKEKVCG